MEMILASAFLDSCSFDFAQDGFRRNDNLGERWQPFAGMTSLRRSDEP